ncbi:unnamed protein product, partial [Thlaspi arvense]
MAQAVTSMAGLRGASQAVLEGSLQINSSNRLNISRVTVGSQRTGLVIRAQQNESVPESSRRSVIGLVAAGLAGGSFVKSAFAEALSIKVGPPPPLSGGLPGTDNSDQARDFSLALKNRFYLQPLPPTEAAARAKESAKEIINVKSLIDKKAWPYVQNDLRLRASYLRYDLNTVISAKPKEEKQSLKELTGKLFQTIDNLDYAARSKSSSDAEKYYSETVSKEKNPNSTEILLPDLVEEIIFRLPLNSILKCRSLSKEWKSILESRRFVEKHKSLQKNRKILAAFHCDCGKRPRLLPGSQFEGDEEIVYLHCDVTRPSMTCDGLVCFLEQDWIIVLNPSTGQLRRLSSGLNPNHECTFGFGLWSSFFPDKWVMGFGRDKVIGRFKVVRMCFSYRGDIGQKDPVVECRVLDVQTGEWRKLRGRPPYVVNASSKSVYLNGSIYWLHINRAHVDKRFKILALDLHSQEFHNVSIPAIWVTWDTQIVNLEDRLAIARTKIGPRRSTWRLEIWSMDTRQEQWSNTYSISLASLSFKSWERNWFTLVAVSKQGNLVLNDNHKRLFKYYPVTNKIICLSEDTCGITTYFETLVPLPIKPSHPLPDPVKSDSKICRLLSKEPGSWILKVLQRNDFRILEILFATLVVAGYIVSPL